MSAESIEEILCRRDRTIADLERTIAEKDSRILDLLSQLDKYRCVLRLASPAVVSGASLSDSSTSPSVSSTAAGRKLQRAWGISAEPQSSLSGGRNDLLATVHSCQKFFKDQNSRALIRQAILDNDFLQHLDDAQVLEIVDCVYPINFDTDNVIIKEGDIGSIVYVLQDGRAEVTKGGQVLSIMSAGKVFGELAILYNCTRTATVRALCPCKVWAIDRAVFKAIMMRTGLLKQAEHLEFLKSVPAFANLQSETIDKISDVLDEARKIIRIN